MASTIRISILADAANAVRGLRTTGAEASRTGRDLTSLQRQVARLEAQNVNINVKTKGFKQAVAEIVTANLALDRLRKGLPDLSFGLTGVANKFALVTAGALAATAAALPLVAATVAVGAGLGAAAAGAGLFAAVALPTFKAVTTAVGEYNTASHAFDRAKSIGDTKAMIKAQKQMASSLGALTPLQRAAALQTIAMNKAWEALSSSQAPLVLSVITTAAGTLAQIIPKLTPAISAMAQAFKSVSGDAFVGLAKSTAPFVSFVKTQGAPAFRSLAAVIGNLLVVVGHIATAFAPLGNIVLARLAPLTAAMRSINFDALAKSATTLLPLVGRLLGNLGGALGNLVKAAAPLAGPVLKGLGDIAGVLKTAFAGPEIKQFVANIAKIVPAVAPIIAVLVPTFLKFADVVSGQLVVLVPKLLPIIQQMADVFLNVLTGLSPLLPALLDLVGVLVSMVPVIFPIVTAFRESMIPVVQAVSAALVQLRPTVAIVIGAFATLFQPVSQIIVALLKIVPVLVTVLVPAFSIVAAAVGQVLTALQPLFPVFTKVTQALSDGLQPVLRAIGDSVPQIVTALDPLLRALLGIALAVLPIIPPVSQLAVALIQALLPAVQQLMPVMLTLADVLAKALPVAIAVLTPILSALTALVSNPAFPAFATATLGIVGAVKAWGIAQGALTAVMKAASTARFLVEYGQLVVSLKASAIATKAAALAQGIYNGVMNSAVVANARAAVSFVAAKVALAASTVATGAATAAQWLFNVALDANPIGLIVLAIAALVAGFIVAYRNSETFRNIVDGALRAVAGAFKFLIDGAKAVFDWLSQHWKLVATIITGPIAPIVIFVISHWKQIHDTTITVFQSIQKFFVSVFSWVRDRFVEFINGVRAIWGGLTSLVNSVIDFRNRVVATITGLIQTFRNIATAIIQSFIDGVRAGFDKVKGVFTDLTSKIASWKGPPARDAKLLTDNGKLILGSLINGIQSQVPALKSQLAGVSSLIQGGVSANANVDLSATGRVPVTLADTAQGGGAPIQVNINVAAGADAAEVGRQAVAAIEAYERRTGRRRLAVAL